MLEKALADRPQEGQRVAEAATGWAAAHARSLADPAGFWGEAAAEIDWIRRWDAVLDDANPPFYRWFRGGVLNTCYNALDRHVEKGRGGQAALIYDSPVTGVVQHYTYRELLGETALFAGALAAQGIAQGDRVVIYMPMVPQAVIAMLACARLGIVHSVIFGGFSSEAI
ncbi:MAG TPA: acetyl-coenzyme A synthetase N-terminal domain-containing protein, partial [Dongiaceae bacterium]